MLDRLKTAKEWLTCLVSLVPVVIAGLDKVFGFLGVSSFFKPKIYTFLFLFSLYALISEIFRYKRSKQDSQKLSQRRKKARSIFVVGVICVVIFYCATESSDFWWPSEEPFRSVAAVILEVVFAIAFERVTRALLIVGLYQPRATST
jgi:hypothetical protein